MVITKVRYTVVQDKVTQAMITETETTPENRISELPFLKYGAWYNRNVSDPRESRGVFCFSMALHILDVWARVMIHSHVINHCTFSCTHREM